MEPATTCCDVVRLEPPPTADDFKQLYEGACQFADPLYREPTRVARMLDYYGRAIDQLQLLPPRNDEPRLSGPQMRSRRFDP